MSREIFDSVRCHFPVELKLQGQSFRQFAFLSLRKIDHVTPIFILFCFYSHAAPHTPHDALPNLRQLFFSRFSLFSQNPRAVQSASASSCKTTISTNHRRFSFVSTNRRLLRRCGVQSGREGPVHPSLRAPHNRSDAGRPPGAV